MASMTVECLICGSDVPEDMMYTCSKGHQCCCLRCMATAAKIAIGEKTMVRCQEKERCDVELDEADLRELLKKVNDPKEFPMSLADEYAQLILMRCVMSIPGIIACPTPGCGNWIISSDVNRAERCKCEGCCAVFCSHCRKPYHYHCSCNEVPKFQERWIEWISGGRDRYHKDKTDAVNKVETARAEIEARNAVLRKKYQDMLADEQFKMENGRYCPQCRRIVIKEGGCDSMVCGRNYHGGNTQDGCGASFDWAQAERYVSETLAKPDEEPMKIDIPDIARSVRHIGIICDMCHTEIRGLRFSCVHCPSCNFCEKCEMEATVAHPRDHVFRIIDSIVPF